MAKIHRKIHEKLLLFGGIFSIVNSLTPRIVIICNPWLETLSGQVYSSFGYRPGGEISRPFPHEQHPTSVRLAHALRDIITTHLMNFLSRAPSDNRALKFLIPPQSDKRNTDLRSISIHHQALRKSGAYSFSLTARHTLSLHLTAQLYVYMQNPPAPWKGGRCAFSARMMLIFRYPSVRGRKTEEVYSA